jgi:alkylhydroperoxidase family enzyme
MAVMQLADTSKLTGKNLEMLNELEKSSGLMPNVMKQMANSPAAIEAFLSSREALGKGFLSAKMRSLVGIMIAEIYSCHYLLAARVNQAKKSGMSDEDLKLAMTQSSSDPKEDRGLQFIRNLVLMHRELSPSEMVELKAIGYSDGEIVELIANVSMNMQVYYMIQVAKPESDYPAVETEFPV